MLPLVTEFSLSLPEFSRFLKILGGVTPPPPHTPSSADPAQCPSLPDSPSLAPLDSQYIYIHDLPGPSCDSFIRLSFLPNLPPPPASPPFFFFPQLLKTCTSNLVLLHSDHGYEPML